jgi:hypothetical protein
MTQWKRAGSILSAAIVFAGATLVRAPEAEAHGRGGRGRVHVGGFYGFAPYFGFGFSPFYYPYGYPYWGYPGFYLQPEGGVDMNVAMMAGWGAVDLEVKPNRADVWVDGRYVGEARDLDGYPSYLWLEQGVHHLAVYKGGYTTFEEDVDVQRGMKKELKVRLEKGESLPPGPKPVDKDKKTEKSDKTD